MYFLSLIFIPLSLGFSVKLPLLRYYRLPLHTTTPYFKPGFWARDTTLNNKTRKTKFTIFILNNRHHTATERSGT
uniref:Putative secreted peptide n=1 Tax=Anopheles braziliensis TaxID=58242 RepID=A0A2M3ZX51_9DIPT